jgi:hypothetical protein
LEEPGIHRRVILKWIFKRFDWREWISKQRKIVIFMGILKRIYCCQLAASTKLSSVIVINTYIAVT